MLDIDPKIPVMTFGLHSLEELAFCLSKHGIPTVCFSDLNSLYLGTEEALGIGVAQYPLLIAGLYGYSYVKREVAFPEGIALTHLLREHAGPNQETPIFLVHYDVLSEDEIPLVSGFQRPKRSFPELLPRNTTFLFSISEKNDCAELCSLSSYIVRHS